MTPPVSAAVLFAITVVVITCPDALGLATPTAIMVTLQGDVIQDAAAEVEGLPSACDPY